MKDFFKPEYFLNEGDIYINYQKAEICADRANKKLNALFEFAPVVYGQAKSITDPMLYDWSLTKLKSDTHKARLVFIEELPKKECHHQPKVIGTYNNFDDLKKPFYAYDHKCVYCGVEIVSTWTAI